MPDLVSPAILVARFLRSNDYHETLEIFVREAGLPADVGNTAAEGGEDSITIEQILQEKKVYDLSLRFEKLGVDEDNLNGWTQSAPKTPATVMTLPTASNILNITVEQIDQIPMENEANPCSVLMASSADRRLNLVNADSGLTLLKSYNAIQDTPMLSFTVVRRRFLLGSSMSGKIVLYDLLSQEVIEERRDHTKYVVKIITFEDSKGIWVATAGWDSKVFLYRIELPLDQGNAISLGEPVARAGIITNPESTLFVKRDSDDFPLLLLTRRDSTFIYYYKTPSILPTRTSSEPAELVLQGRQNLAPHSNAWIAFTPCAMSICPTDPTLLAVATSAIPHLKLIIVRLLFPGQETLQTNFSVQPTSIGLLDSLGPSEPITASSQARAALVLQDREAAAIQIHCTTLAPQTQYSTPAVAWRPDGTGVWVNSDDGVVRGIEASTGKIVVALQAHEPGSKIRCVWAGMVNFADAGGRMKQKEWLVTGGFDQKLILWTTPEVQSTSG